MSSNQVASTTSTNLLPVQAEYASTGNETCLGLYGQAGQPLVPPMNLQSLSVGGCLCISNQLPTLGTGWGTGATITASNTSAFKIIVGTGGSSGGTINFPASSTGWVLQAWDITGANTLFLQQSGSSTTSASLTSFGITTGTASPMTAGDMVLVMAMAF